MNYFFGDRHTIVDESKVVTMNQIHSNIVKYVTVADIGTDVHECDGIVTDCRNVPLVVKTADCVPLLMWWNESVIAAVHAGWRGTVQSIAVKGVELMEKHGAVREQINIAVGPSIKFECYEVKNDFCDTVDFELGTGFCDLFVRQHDGILCADVKGMNIKLLTDCGINPDNITVNTECTCCNMDKYHSYRGSGGTKKGNMRSVIVL